jgi:hypothetical protein
MPQYLPPPALRLLLYLCCFYTVVHSVFIAHKEHRFLVPLLPLLCIVAGDWLNTCIDERTMNMKQFATITMNNFWSSLSTSVRRWSYFLLIVANGCSELEIRGGPVNLSQRDHSFRASGA